MFKSCEAALVDIFSYFRLTKSNRKFTFASLCTHFFFVLVMTHESTK